MLTTSAFVNGFVSGFCGGIPERTRRSPRPHAALCIDSPRAIHSEGVLARLLFVLKVTQFLAGVLCYQADLKVVTLQHQQNICAVGLPGSLVDQMTRRDGHTPN